MIDKEKKSLEAYKTTINSIDDWFEYANESKKDREFIHKELDKLTAKLLKIYKCGLLVREIEPTIRREMRVILKRAKTKGLKNTVTTRALITEDLRKFMFVFRQDNEIIQNFQVLCNEWNNVCLAGLNNLKVTLEYQLRGANDTVMLEESFKSVSEFSQDTMDLAKQVAEMKPDDRSTEEWAETLSKDISKGKD